MQYVFREYQKRPVPVDTGRKLNLHKTSWTSSERLMYVQFTSCVCGSRMKWVNAKNFSSIKKQQPQFFLTPEAVSRRLYCQKGVLKKFVKFTGKHLSQSLFFNKVAGWGLQNYWKRDSVTGVFLYVLWNLEHAFYRTPKWLLF